ncbi:MAG: hypothetical protein HRF48_10115 [Chloroflexota bacterium]
MPHDVGFAGLISQDSQRHDPGKQQPANRYPARRRGSDGAILVSHARHIPAW